MGLDQAIEAEAQAQAICMQTRRLRPRLPRLRRQGKAGVRGQLMADRTFLAWPFFEDRHRALAERSTPGATDNLARSTTPTPTPPAATLVRQARRRRLAAPTPPSTPTIPAPLDVRTLCLIRETLARHDGLADFAFAMQGLGTGAISPLRHARAAARWLPEDPRRRRASPPSPSPSRSPAPTSPTSTMTATPRRRRLRPRRREDLDLQRRHRRPLHRLRPHRRGARRQRPLRLPRARRHARPARSPSASRPSRRIRWPGSPSTTSASPPPR